MVLDILTKKHVRAILTLLDENEEMYVSEIQRILEIDGGNLSALMNKLVKEHIIEKRREPQGESIGKSYYSLTELGKRALKFYELDNEFEKDRSKIVNQTNIKGKVGKVINVGGDNTTLNIK